MGKSFRVRLKKIKKIFNKKRLLILILPIIIIIAIPLPNPLFDTLYTTTIESKEGELLGAMIAKDGQWRFPNSEKLPLKLEKSTLHFEDEYFYYHLGINPFSLVKAIWINLKTGTIKRGGSTISMQVIRMALGNKKRTVWQKIKETLMAVKLEFIYSKKEILNIYAGHAPYGGNVVGLSAASWRYFGRHPEKLSWSESAALAVLPNSPSLIYPGKNELKLKNKRNKLLFKLYKSGIIDLLTYELALVEELPGKPLELPRLAPRLLTRTISEGQEGKRNIVTLDPKLQETIKNITQRYMEDFSANSINNAAVLVIEIETGEAKTYIGNIDSDNIHSQDVDIITSPRSTGSLLKPFLYAAAIDEGLITPNQLLKDYPVFFEGFSPKNFDLTFRGAVHAKEALTRSLNLPFVLMLRDYGYERFHQKLKRIGMTSLTKPPGHYGLSMVLGGAEATLWDLTNMYANLFRVYKNSFSFSWSERYNGLNYFKNQYLVGKKNTTLKTGIKPDEFSIGAAWMTIDALKGLIRPQAFAGWEKFDSSTQIAWKTGTSFGFRDAWSIGINGKYVVGVWVGNADGEGRPNIIGGKAAAPLMFKIIKQLESIPFSKIPESETKSFTICSNSGQKSNPYCKETYEAFWPQTVEYSTACTYHQLVHLDKKFKYQVNSSCYNVDEINHLSWFILPPVQAWYYRQYNLEYKSLPSFKIDCQETGDKPTMQMIYPSHSSKIFIPRELNGKMGETIFEAAHSNIQQIIYWHLDGEYLGSTIRNHQMGIIADRGIHQLTLLDGQGLELKINFEVLNEE